MANKEYENRYYNEGYQFIAGTDEAGRGCLAGPLVVAAVILPKDFENSLINDSKQVSKKHREELFEVIKSVAISYAIIEIDPKKVDEVNIYQASKIGMIKAIKELDHQVDVILSDAMPFKFEGAIVEPLIHGDAKSLSIAAASILAKVHRDKLMDEYEEQYPGYDFKHNKGYGTKKHLEALDKFGITPIHRLTYKPVQDIKNKQLSFEF
jgi:ribonuclease HII